MPAVGGYLIYTLLGYWIDNYELSKNGVALSTPLPWEVSS